MMGWNIGGDDDMHLAGRSPVGDDIKVPHLRRRDLEQVYLHARALVEARMLGDTVEETTFWQTLRAAIFRAEENQDPEYMTKEYQWPDYKSEQVAGRDDI